MNPQITAQSEESGILSFTLSSANTSVANALRRTIISDIPLVGMITFPDEDNDCNIKHNTTRFTNEIIKHRLSQVPVHIDDLSIPLDQYLVVVDKKNVSDTIYFITTEDFQIINTQNGESLSASDRNKIFPPNKITGDYIDFIRLRPRLSADIEGESLSLSCKLRITMAKNDSVYNVASTCSYGNTPDPIKANDAWTLKAKELVLSEMSKQDIEYEKKNWYLLDAKRHFKADSFDFILETIGIYDNSTIIKMACRILQDKFSAIKDTVDTDTISIKPSVSTIEFSHDITLENYDYTEGKVLEYLFYTLHYQGDKTLSYCGFRKDHPHNKHSKLRIAFKKQTDKAVIKEYLRNICDEGIRIFAATSSQF